MISSYDTLKNYIIRYKSILPLSAISAEGCSNCYRIKCEAVTFPVLNYSEMETLERDFSQSPCQIERSISQIISQAISPEKQSRVSTAA